MRERGGIEILDKDQNGEEFLGFRIRKISTGMEVPIRRL